MHSISIWLAAAAFLYISGNLLSRRLRDWHGAEWMHLSRDCLDTADFPDTQFDAVDPQSMEAVRTDAEAAALAAAAGGPVRSNGHAPGTRAHIVWETSFHARLIYLTERRPGRGGELAASIDQLRVPRSAQPLATR